ncbi:MAG TPA: hypothetical protein VMC10_14975 [Stellaceae bacterium]|nr:hypothetical protein [Stellaceae bacterium]
MQKLSDELLIAYLDGELDAEAAAEVAVTLEQDSDLNRHALALAESAVALRATFDDVLHEPVPERLLAAARGETQAQTVIQFPDPRQRQAKRAGKSWRRWAALPIAASVASLVIGGTLGYFAATSPELAPTAAQQQQLQAVNTQVANSSWLDNIAGYHKMFVAAGPNNDMGLVDIPADPQNAAARKLTQQLPQDFRLPNLKPWGLVFQGARFLFIEGRPATQLFYTTDNAALGPLTVVVASTNLPDSNPAFDRRNDLNVLYWRHQGHIYALVGSADIGYLWNIHNDLAWQLDAI